MKNPGVKNIFRGLAALIAACALRVCTLSVANTPEQANARTYRGAVHVHSNASHDASQTPESVAEDAKKAGLDFVVLTDHNAHAGEPRYVGETLLLPEVEWSLAHGHVIALGGNAPDTDTRAADPWPALQKTGSYLYGAHPDSKKNPLDDAAFAHLSGDEVLSSSSDFYAGLTSQAAFFLFAFPFRPALALSALYPERAHGIERYEKLSAGHDLALFCGDDDHGWTKRTERLLSYVTYVPKFFPEREAHTDATLLRAELEGGAFYCALGLFGDASPLSVTVNDGGGVATFGAHVAMPAKLRVRWNGPVPEGHHYFLYRDGELAFDSADKEFTLPLDVPGRYRLEVERTTPGFFGARHVRWIYGNPIWVEPGTA